MDEHPTQEVWLIRHAETEWSRSGQHTGRTDVPLTDAGRERAQALGALMGDRDFALVLSSPLGRARETARLAGYGDPACQVREDLLRIVPAQGRGVLSDVSAQALFDRCMAHVG